MIREQMEKMVVYDSFSATIIYISDWKIIMNQRKLTVLRLIFEPEISAISRRKVHT
jgi:hypothetical protein